MSAKDVKLYYDEVCNQYSDMLSELRDFEKEAEQGLIEPERLDKIKESIQPLMNNYQTLSYIMFLLNKPVKKSKHAKYQKQNQKLLNSIKQEFTKQGCINTNEQSLDALKRALSSSNEQ